MAAHMFRAEGFETVSHLAVCSVESGSEQSFCIWDILGELSKMKTNIFVVTKNGHNAASCPLSNDLSLFSVLILC